MIRYLAHKARGHYMRRVYWQPTGSDYGVHRYWCWSCARGWGASR